VVATPKHYAVHSGPEVLRHNFNVPVSKHDLMDTYVPAFRAAVVEGKADSVMCAYNAVAGQPACASDGLQKLLRNRWGFDGYEVSDCGAIADIYAGHRYVLTIEQASALAVKTGTDLACGREYSSLVSAVRNRQISEADISQAVKRLFTARFRLGMFDPPERVAYARIPMSENDSPAHRQLALQAARESIVLLKNEGDILPLRKSVKTIAVIGPNADSVDVLLGNYNGTPSKPITILAGIQNKFSNLKVLYAQGSLLTETSSFPIPPDAFRAPGLTGQYFDNLDLQGKPANEEVARNMNFSWDTEKPGSQFTQPAFSARFTGVLVPKVSGEYRLGATADGQVRVYLDGDLLIEELSRPPRARSIFTSVTLQAGHPYKIAMEYSHQGDRATAKLVWSPPELLAEALDVAKKADVVVAPVGISPRLEGEEMDVNSPGFFGGDRVDLDLPRTQQELLDALIATGKPVVVVLLSGSALAVNRAQQHAAAILEAWYPGQDGGTAVAETLSGANNPSGRLPVTFYRSVAQLPPFTDYSLRGRTYRYFQGHPLYPFGYGLSYSQFRYRDLKLSAPQILAGENIQVVSTVENVSQRSGDEVVELYVSHVSPSPLVPLRSLAGFRRIHLNARERQTVSFVLAPAQLGVVNADGNRVVEPGRYRISVGGQQPDRDGLLVQQGKVIQVDFAVAGPAAQVPD
jgi:beta-glucosidase